MEAARESLRNLLAAWETGVFFPRMENTAGGRPAACGNCDVADACLRQDSGARRRLADRVARLRDEMTAGKELSDRDRILALQWWRTKLDASQGAEGGS